MAMNNPIFGMGSDPMGNQMNMMNNPSMNPMGNQMNMMNNPSMNPMGNQMNMMNNPSMNPMGNQMNMMNNPFMNQMGMNPMNMINNNLMMFNMMNQNMNAMSNLANTSQLMQMANQQQNNNLNNQQDQGVNIEDPQLELIFIKNNGDANKKQLKIFCLSSEKVKDIVEKYRVKAQDFNQNENFVFNAKKLNLELTAGESGLINKSRIFVLNKEGVEGGK